MQMSTLRDRKRDKEKRDSQVGEGEVDIQLSQQGLVTKEREDKHF